LGKEIGGNVTGIRALVGDEDCFGGSIQTVDADNAKDLALGERGEQATRAENFVDAGDFLRAKCECTNRLRTSESVDARDLCDMRGGETFMESGNVVAANLKVSDAMVAAIAPHLGSL